MSAVWSTMRRLISSGTRWSKQRLPASMWKIGILRRLAGMTARQLLVSPSTSIASGCSAPSTPIDGDDNVADGLGRGAAGGRQEVVGLAHAEILEEDLVELVVVVLAGMHEHVVAMPVERGDDARQPDDLRPGADDGHDLQLVHRHDLHGHGVGPRAVENLVGPQHHDHLVVADIGDVVRPAGDGFDHQRRSAAWSPARTSRRSAMWRKPNRAWPWTTRNFSVLVWW